MLKSRTPLLTFFLTAVAIVATGPSNAADRDSFDGGTTVVNTIEVPVRVVDSDSGDWISGLSAADFRVFEDGHQVPITGFFEARSARSTEGSATADIRPVTHDLLVFVDLYLAVKPDKNRAVDGLRDALAKGLLFDGTRVAVVSFNGSLQVHTDYTNNEETLLTAIDEVEGITARGLQTALSIDTAGGFGSWQGYQRHGRHSTTSQYWYEIRRRMEIINGAVTASLARFASTPNRRSLLFLTPGYPRAKPVAYTGFETWGPASIVAEGRLLEQVGLEAAELGFTIFTLETTGVRAPRWSGADRRFGSFNRHRQTSSSYDMDRRANAIAVAKQTGGRAFFDPDVASSMARVGDELGAYYSIAYEAQHQGDGRVHEIEVVLVPNLDADLRYRQAYVDRPLAARESDALRADLLSIDNNDNPLGVLVEFGTPESKFRFGAAGMKRVMLPVAISVPYSSLELVERGDIYWGQLRLVILNVSPQGDQSPTTSILEEIVLKQSDIDEARANGSFVYTATLAMEGGDTSLRVAVQDELSGNASTLELALDL